MNNETLKKANELSSLIATMENLLNEENIWLRESADFMKLEIQPLGVKEKDILRPVLDKAMTELWKKIKEVKLDAEKRLENL